MNQTITSCVATPPLAADQKQALANATSAIPPSWPLDRWIAVNPWWGLRHLPAEQAARIPGAQVTTSMLMPPAFYKGAWASGRIQEEDLHNAVAEAGAHYRPDTLVSMLNGKSATTSRGAPLMLDLAVTSGGTRITEAVRQQVAHACGLFFDVRQSRWLAETESADLFESWLEQSRNDLLLDRRVGLTGARSILANMAADTSQAYEWAIRTLDIPADDLETLGQRLLFELIGWGSWCKGVDWRAALEGNQSDLCDQLLAILLVWEASSVTLASPKQRQQWQSAWQQYRKDSLLRHDEGLWVWHRAYELGYQRSLIRILAGASDKADDQVSPNSPHAPTPDFQAVFCIDVRSELMRRHLEAACPEAQTLGFAGFFGMPVAHRSLEPGEEIPRLPGLLAPSYRLVDSKGDRSADLVHRQASYQREITRQTIRKAKYSSLSTFTLVETTGLAWAWKLVRDSLNLNTNAANASSPLNGELFHQHGGDPVSDKEKVDLAENLLRGMSLTTGFSALLVFVGHGSHTDNNPQQAGLACGACGGQNGGINARLAARLVNNPQVRSGLAKRGISIPDGTLAVAAEHCTVTDQVTVLDSEQIPDSHRRSLVRLEGAFTEAAQHTRRERATALKLNGLADDALLQQLIKRTVNWSEVRPEWGLANNAAIIFAKRTRTRARNLAGRVFLHDYDATLDPEGKVLESLMTAPMVVANWINLQYLGSVAAPDTFGAGNKLLHSVVGGNVGVIEGSDPDLRIGLSHQSVHDGQTGRHEPVRLSVVIDAPRQSIERVIAQQPDVAHLVKNHWLWLFRYAQEGIEHYHNGEWRTS